MSRKDTILIAIFVNTGVLGLLFLMGVNTEDSSPTKNELPMAYVEKPALSKGRKLQKFNRYFRLNRMMNHLKSMKR